MGNTSSVGKCPGCGQGFKGYERMLARGDYHDDCAWKQHETKIVRTQFNGK
jgi:hypothetical protein